MMFFYPLAIKWI